jgi:hypothetical protein
MILSLPWKNESQPSHPKIAAQYQILPVCRSTYDQFKWRRCNPAPITRDRVKTAGLGNAAAEFSGGK